MNIETLARAGFAHGRDEVTDIEWRHMQAYLRDDAIAFTRAILEAMRDDIDEAAVEAARKYLRHGNLESETNIWAALGGMIDSILAQPEKEA